MRRVLGDDHPDTLRIQHSFTAARTNPHEYNPAG